MVEHMPRHAEVKGLNPVGTGREKSVKTKVSRISAKFVEFQQSL